MSGNRYAGLKTGKDITSTVRRDLARTGVALDLIRRNSNTTPEYRKEQLAAYSREAREVLAEGRAAMHDWARRSQAEARRAMVPELGTAAEEMRRNTIELRISRLVDQGKPNSKQEAETLAAKADQAYVLGSLDEAEVFARAAIELGGPSAPRLAQEVSGLIEYDRISQDPSRAKARAELAQTDILLGVFERDVAAEHSRVLADQARMAQTLGDSAAVSSATSEAAHQSVASKMRAFQLANQTGTPYVEPLGALPGGPFEPGATDRPEPEPMLAPGEAPWKSPL
jgi:hypothetical protein